MKNGIIIIWILGMMSVIQSCLRNDHSNQIKSDTTNIVESPYTFVKNTLDTLAIAQGDLNSDNISDLVVVFKSVGEDTISGTVPKRPLKIYFGLTNGSYSLCCASDNIIMTYDMGGASTPEPFDNILVKDGVLIVGHHGGMGSYHWNQTVKFKYSLLENVFYVNQIEKNDGKSSDNPLEAFEKEIVKSEKDLAKLTFEKYTVFNNEE